MAAEAELIGRRYNIDEVAYIPMTKRDVRERGFNQCKVFAQKICERLEIEFNKDILIKTRQTLPQKNLSAKRREINLKGAFKATCELYGKTVLLIDDVTTTGATLREAAKELVRAGAYKVVALTFAKV